MEKRMDIVCMGMALVDSIIKGFDPNPVSASGYRAVSGSLNVGGEAVNEAMTASKLGMKVSIVCSLGPDDAGDMVLATLTRLGVDTASVIRSSEHPTPVTTMFVNDDGTRKSITNHSHKYNFHPEKYHESFTGTRALILGSLFRAPFDDPGIIHEVLNTAKKAGVVVFADTKLPNFRKISLDDIKGSLDLIDFLTPNEDEAKFFSGKDDPDEMADVFLNYGVKNVVIKLGSKGCFFKNKDGIIKLPAFNINAVDATGAGDSFVAGMAGELLHGFALEQSKEMIMKMMDKYVSGKADSRIFSALVFGNACGAVCTTAVGAGTAIKDRRQILDFLEKNSCI